MLTPEVKQLLSTTIRGLRTLLLAQTVKESGATLIHRLVMLRHLEAVGLVKLALIGPDGLESYVNRLDAEFTALSVELPGLYGERGLTKSFPIPPAILREVITKLHDPGLDGAWDDDTTLGWVYQYWNDPEREAIDAHLDAQNKLGRSDIASKTQVFTERYMVEWLLENSLGQIWLCICKKHGWAVDPASKYYVPEPLTEESVIHAPDSIRSVKLLDPACGCGHFLVAAFDMLVAMYRAEATHRRQPWSDAEIAESILANNLHGVDIDPQAVLIAAAVLFVKVRTLSKSARPTRVNLVAPTFQFGNLPKDDPSFVQLRSELKREAGIPEALTLRLLAELALGEHLGTLLNVDSAVEQLVGSAAPAVTRGAKEPVLAHLAQFLARHSVADELGLRLGVEPSTAGVRLMRIVKEGSYDVVVGNPPYFGTQSLADAQYIDVHYPQSKENLCTAFLDRSMELVRPAGLVAFVTVRNWLYVSQLSAFRKRVFQTFPPQRVIDLELGGFESLPGVEGVLLVAQAGATGDCFVARAKGADPKAKIDSIEGLEDTYRTSPALLAELPGSPFVYRWSKDFVAEFLDYPLLGNVAPVRVGMKTSDNHRFLRCPWELAPATVRASVEAPTVATWTPYVKGAGGKAWIEPLSDLVNWRNQGLEIRLALDAAYKQGPQGEKHFFKPGVAFSTIGRSFVARAHRYPSLFDVAGSSVFPDSVAATVCLLNSRFAREVVEALNPTINFQVGDVGRIPFDPDSEAEAIFSVLEMAFIEQELVLETSVRFQKPGATAWRYAQAWAQRAVDRSKGEPLPAYEPEYESSEPESYVSFGVGIALGRFGANGEGVLDQAPVTALPDGILFIAAEGRDSLERPACSKLHELWAEQVAKARGGDTLRAYLRTAFFAYHKKVYENRPIYLPLASARKSYVAWVSIHRFRDDTLHRLLGDYLLPEKGRLERESEVLRRSLAESAGNGQAVKRVGELQRLFVELVGFIELVTELVERGPQTPDDKTPRREVDVALVLNLEDGVQVNSAALWPLLEPYWKEPKKWWTQLAARRGPKGTHFDWSTLAKRYFPTRVEAQCVSNPVLAAAHRCLWEYHPAVAFKWELRLTARFGSAFAVSEEGATGRRDRFLEENAANGRVHRGRTSTRV